MKYEINSTAGNFFTFFQHEQQKNTTKNYFPTLFGRRIENAIKTDLIRVCCLFELDHVKAMPNKIPPK